MKAIIAFVVILAICSVECRKVLQINKNANIDFINMESGGGAQPAVPLPGPSKPQTPQHSLPPPSKPQTPQQSPTVTQAPVPVVTTAKPVLVPVPTHPPATPIKPTMPKPVQPVPNQMDLKPVPARAPAAGGVTTPGYGNVKQLVTFYDSKGQASVIRPYSYADAVKKPKTN